MNKKIITGVAIGASSLLFTGVSGATTTAVPINGGPIYAVPPLPVNSEPKSYSGPPPPCFVAYPPRVIGSIYGPLIDYAGEVGGPNCSYLTGTSIYVAGYQADFGAIAGAGGNGGDPLVVNAYSPCYIGQAWEYWTQIAATWAGAGTIYGSGSVGVTLDCAGNVV